ncbi:MAG: DUF2802 domain-containing protein [Azoarcus sp.]|jgi:hypothetical protein|nr:DUF2802 domain-containing protein [Azoarcus sp.]
MRQLIWGLIAVLLLYGAWQFISALRIERFRRSRDPLLGKRGMSAGLEDDLFGYAPLPAKTPPAPDPVSPNHSTVVRNVAPDNSFDPFALELELQRLRREIGSMRESFEIQRQEMDALRADLERLAARPREPRVMTTEPDVSPEYDEALALARRGVMADVIATRCGITRAEADLVASLAARARQRETEGRLP